MSVKTNDIIADVTKLNETGLKLLNSKQYRKAITYFNKILKIFPNDYVALYNKGLALEQLGNIRKANHYYTLSLENTNYEDKDALLSKGLTHGMLNELDDAIECFDKLIKLDPNNYLAWHNRGVAYQEMHVNGDIEIAHKSQIESEKCFRKAKRLKRLQDKKSASKKKAKKIKTLFGKIENTSENKESAYSEVSHTEDVKIRNAQRALHARLGTEEREKAWKWVAYYQNLVNVDDV